MSFGIDVCSLISRLNEFMIEREKKNDVDCCIENGNQKNLFYCRKDLK